MMMLMMMMMIAIVLTMNKMVLVKMRMVKMMMMMMMKQMMRMMMRTSACGRSTPDQRRCLQHRSGWFFFERLGWLSPSSLSLHYLLHHKNRTFSVHLCFLANKKDSLSEYFVLKYSPNNSCSNYLYHHLFCIIFAVKIVFLLQKIQSFVSE